MLAPLQNKNIQLTHPTSLCLLALTITLATLITGCSDDPAAASNTDTDTSAAAKADQPRIAVTTTWIETLVNDLFAGDAQIFSIIPPGNCPGHFDIAPAQLNDLRNSHCVIAFDFQKQLHNTIRSFSHKQYDLIVLPALGGLSVPDSYETAANVFVSEFSQRFPDRADQINANYRAIKMQCQAARDYVQALTDDLALHNQVALTSIHQEQFCRFMGFADVLTFSSAHADNPAQLNQLLHDAQASRVAIVIANLQEGTQLPQSLAAQLNVPCAVVTNFPTAQQSFYQFVAANAAAVQQALLELDNNAD